MARRDLRLLLPTGYGARRHVARMSYARSRGFSRHDLYRARGARFSRLRKVDPAISERQRICRGGYELVGGAAYTLLRCASFWSCRDDFGRERAVPAITA